MESAASSSCRLDVLTMGLWAKYTLSPLSRFCPGNLSQQQKCHQGACSPSKGSEEEKSLSSPTALKSTRLCSRQRPWPTDNLPGLASESSSLSSTATTAATWDRSLYVTAVAISFDWITLCWFFLSSIPPYSSPYFSQTTASFSLPIHTHSINFLSLSFHLSKPKLLNKTLSQNNPHKCHSHYHCVHGRGQKPSSGSCLYNLPPYFFETGFLTKLRACHLARLDGQQTPIIHLSLQLWSGYTHWKRKKKKNNRFHPLG